MPIYKTRCVACAKDDSRRLTFAEYDRVSAGQNTLACECGGSCQLEFEPSAVSFVLKDGEAGGWVSKATRENKYRAGRRAEMGRRQSEHVSPNKLVPNYHGEVAGSWAEAKDAAYQSTYQKVNRDHGAKTAARAASAAANTYDTHVKREGS